jgi:hypothetical protein
MSPRLPNFRPLRIVSLVLFAWLSAAPLSAGNPQLSKYPMRVHVLASDQSFRSPRMSPGESVTCDFIEGMVDSISPNPGGPISISGVSGDPCSLHPEMVTGRLMNLDDDPVYSGAGRGDLVSPPSTTLGLTFHYDNCSRVRVNPGFQSLPARWKKPGQKLEVLIPSDEIPVNGRPHAPDRCILSVVMHDFIYLLLRNGSVIEVSQEDFWKRPGLRMFLSGNTQTIQQRTQQFTVSAHPAK